MKRFTANTSLWTVVHCKQFKSFKKYIISPRQFRSVMQLYRIKHLRWFYPFDVNVVLKTLNEMSERCGRGEELYHSFGGDVGLYSFVVGKNRPFILLLPGGGYGDVCVFAEGFPIAVRLNKLGYNVFVGQYRIGKQAHYPNPQDDVADFIRYIFDNAERLNVNTENYAVCGCSAGGHLAASWGTENVGYKRYGLAKPKTLMLAYPVISMGEHTHKGSQKNLLGKDRRSKILQDRYSVEKHIDGNYPETYIWQCKNDSIVPYENSLLLVEALQNSGVRNKLFAVEGNAHGWGVAKGTAAEGWLEQAIEFWQTNK